MKKRELEFGMEAQCREPGVVHIQSVHFWQILKSCLSVYTKHINFDIAPPRCGLDPLDLPMTSPEQPQTSLIRGSLGSLSHTQETQALLGFNLSQFDLMDCQGAQARARRKARRIRDR